MFNYASTVVLNLRIIFKTKVSNKAVLNVKGWGCISENKTAAK